jgi:predicted lipoprotein with Yx(FWY)xxD motif
MLKTLAIGLFLSTCALTAPPAFAATVTVAANAAVGITAPPAVIAESTSGKIWVNSLGMSLYTFNKDTVAGKSMCNDKCATEWPPLAVADGAVASGDWTIVTRDDGTKMWAYEGHPLYAFLDDKKAGDITGDNKDGFKVAM